MESDVPTSNNGLWDVRMMIGLLICIGIWICYTYFKKISRSGRKKNRDLEVSPEVSQLYNSFLNVLDADGLKLEDLKNMFNIADHQGKTALHKSAIKGNLDIIEFLIQNGARIDVKEEKSGRTALHMATKPEVAKLLIEKGAQIEAKDTRGRTPLLICAMESHVEVAQVLVQHGAQVNSKTGGGNTPLNFATSYGHIDMVKLLIQNGAQVDIKGQHGNTPLHGIMQSRGIGAKRHFEIVKYLIEHGAPIDTKNNISETPFDKANRNGHIEIAKYLLEKKKESKGKNPEENLSSKALCIICLTPRNEIFVLSPCGHTTLCEPCCFSIKNQTDPKCPSCRKPIIDYMKIFYQ